MRRQRISRPATRIDLFPFLSILACTIGTLILLIIVITTQTFGSSREVTIVAESESGVNQTKSPRYIECREDGVVLHPSLEFVPQEQIDQPNSALTELIVEVSNNRDSEYLIVAVRPDGIEVFQEVRELIEQQGIDIGYEPIDQNWKLKIQE
ncbi:MAG: hypothetical protein ACFB4I_17205 [Cyanophyceae cyanobacterium]